MRFIATVLGSVAFIACSLEVAAATGVAIPNHSFEAPTALFPSPNINSWQKTAKPVWYDESGGFLWTQLTGVFRNPPPSSTSNHIDNCDGLQGAWLFAVPEVGLFQDYDSIDWNDPAPTREFNVTYETGRSYHLTIGVIGTGGGMQEGATLELGLFYRDAASNRVMIVTTVLTNTPEVFSNNTHFVDCHVDLPTVRATDAWAGKKLGIQILSTVTPELQGGYWDIDNVRVNEGPTLTNVGRSDGELRFSILGELGGLFEIQSATNLATTSPDWTIVGVITNAPRLVPFIDTTASFPQRYYRVRQLP